MPRIDLSFQVGASVVLLVRTGVRYSNQAGGTSCLHPDAEGALAPLENDAAPDRPEHSVSGRLQALFPEGTPQVPITEALADRIDAILGESNLTSFVRVDRERLAESYEAWVYVVVESQPTVTSSFILDVVAGFERVGGILTWPNSD